MRDRVRVPNFIAVDMREFLSFLFFVAMVTACVSAPPRVPAHPSVEDLYSSTSVIEIMHSDGSTGMCGGVWVDKHKLLTAGHCARDLDAAYVLRSNEDKITLGLVLRSDADHDLALLYAPGPAGYKIAPIALASPRVGDDVFLMGHPGGLEFTYYRAWVAGLREVFDIPLTGPWLQVEAPVWRGHSGSGAFDQYGQLIGIGSWIYPRVPGTGFYVPVETIRNFLAGDNEKR